MADEANSLSDVSFDVMMDEPVEYESCSRIQLNCLELQMQISSANRDRSTATSEQMKRNSATWSRAETASMECSQAAD